MAAAVQRKQHLSDDEDASGFDSVIQQSAAQEPPKKTGAAAVTAAAAIRHLHKQTLFKRIQQTLFKRIQQKLDKLRSWLWYWIEELFEEFQPWLKWIIFDAALTVVVGQLVKHVECVRPMFEAVGWA